MGHLAESVLTGYGRSFFVETRTGGGNMGRFYTEKELRDLGVREFGEDVRISKTAIIVKPEYVKIGSHVRIDDYVLMTGSIWLHSYIHISSFCSLGGRAGIVMEDFSGLSAGVRIFSASDDYSGEFMTNPTVPEKFTNVTAATVYLRKHVIVGANSVILPGVEIEHGGAVGAISLVTRDVPAFEIHAGTPAKKVSERKRNLIRLEEQLMGVPK